MLAGAISRGPAPLRDSPETAVRKVRGGCEMAASLREFESWSRERPLLEAATKQRNEERD
jgi:hypothetical protein